MQKIKESNKMNNRGFTLIEMIVTVAIIAIFAGVVLSFITTGSNLFRNTSNTAKVQMETQETFDKIEDIIINSNRKLSYGESSHIFEVASFDEQVAAKSAQTSVAARLKATKSGSSSSADEENVRDYIIWNQTTEEITYIHSENSDGTWRNSNTSSVNPQGDVLATGVTYFQADVSKAVSDNIVNFVLKTRKGTKEVETVHSVSLRNNLNIDYSPNEPFDNPTIDPVTPAPVSPTPEPVKVKPVSLLSDKKSILIAAGASYDLGGNITWKVLYSDATTSSSGNLSWSVNGCSYASISSEGILSVNADAGTSETGKITITVTDVDHENVYGTLTVSVARIDLIIPQKDATYKVGNQKQLQYTYLEGGKAPADVGTVATVTTEQKPDTASAYSDGGSFVQNDIGNWKVKATVDLSGRKGYDITCGVVKATSAFTVIAAVADIYVNGDTSIDALVVGRTYDCMPTIQYGFNWLPVSLDVLWNTNSLMRWYLKNNPAGISIDNTEYAYPDVVRHITIDENVRQGFIICADFKKDNGDGTSIQLHAEREIKVVNGIQLTALNGDTAYAYERKDSLYSEGYEMNLLLNVYDVNGKNVPLCVSSEAGTRVDWTGLGSSGEITASSDKKNWLFMPNVNDVDQTLQVAVSIQRVAPQYGIFDTNNNYYGEEEKGNTIADFKKSLSVKISEPEFTAQIIPGEDETIEPGTTKEMYLELLDKNGNAVERDVEWSVKNASFGHMSKGKTGTGAEQTTVFSADKPGTYTIIATYKTVPKKSHSVTKTITVRKPEVDLTLHGSATGYKGDTGNYWLEAKIDGQDATDLQVKWSTDWAGKVNKDTSEIGQNGAVQVTFGLWADSCEITVTVTVAGETKKISKEVKLKAHEYSITVTAVDPDTNEVINSCIPETTVKFVVQVYLDENIIENCDVIWNPEGGRKFNTSGNTATYTIGKGENSISFQIQATRGNKTQYAQIQFGGKGVTIVNKW